MLVLFFTEFVVSFLVGGAPILYAYANGGVDGLGVMLNSRLPKGEIVYYSLGLTVFAFLMDFASRIVWKASDSSIRIWGCLEDICAQIASSIQSVFRIAAGILITFVCLWFAADYKSFSLPSAAIFLGMATLALVENSALRYAQKQSEKRWPRRKISLPL